MSGRVELEASRPEEEHQDMEVTEKRLMFILVLKSFCMQVEEKHIKEKNTVMGMLYVQVEEPEPLKQEDGVQQPRHHSVTVIILQVNMVLIQEIAKDIRQGFLEKLISRLLPEEPLDAMEIKGRIIPMNQKAIPPVEDKMEIIGLVQMTPILRLKEAEGTEAEEEPAAYKSCHVRHMDPEKVEMVVMAL